MQSRCILPWEDTSIFENDRYDLQVLFDREPGAAVCYYTTVFSGNRLFGDMAVLYDTPDGYDDVFRHWLKSVSIGLEFLRLKKWHLTRGSHRFSSGCFLHFKILHFSVVRRLGIDKLKLPKKRSFSLSIKLCF